jgi:hypothetical protein
MNVPTPGSSKPTPFAWLLPVSLREWIKRRMRWTEREMERQLRRNPFASEPPDYDVAGSQFKLGILREFYQAHMWYVTACREMGVSYRVIDLSADDWPEVIAQSGCEAFLVWPTPHLRVWREMFDSRLRLLEEEMRRFVYPTYHETWLYESKRRMFDWLRVKRLPYPRTWVFYERRLAESFAATAELPLVVKTSLGGAHSGVWILRTRRGLERAVRRAFSTGLIARSKHQTEAEANAIVLQEYLPDVREWRLVRIGDSYFGHPKAKVGDFHSGSGRVEWTPPEKRHLDFLKHVTDVGGFTSMNVDAFETKDGRLLVNELHTVFGSSIAVHQAKVCGKFGRFVYAPQADSWSFQEGEFARNACANARVEYVLRRLRDDKARSELPETGKAAAPNRLPGIDRS